MFKAKNICTGEVRTVYGLCGTSFLFFCGVDDHGNAQWCYGDISDYMPFEGDSDEN